MRIAGRNPPGSLTPMASSTIRVWLPGPDAVELMGGLGATRQAGARAMAVVRDQLARYAAGEPLLNIVGEQGY